MTDVDMKLEPDDEAEEAMQEDAGSPMRGTSPPHPSDPDVVMDEGVADGTGVPRPSAGMPEPMTTPDLPTADVEMLPVDPLSRTDIPESQMNKRGAEINPDAIDLRLEPPMDFMLFGRKRL